MHGISYAFESILSKIMKRTNMLTITRIDTILRRSKLFSTFISAFSMHVFSRAVAEAHLPQSLFSSLFLFCFVNTAGSKGCL